MKDNFIYQGGTGVLKMRGDDFVQATVAIYVQVVHAFLKMHRIDKTHQSQVMIAVKVTDKDVVDTMKIHLKAHQPHLSRLSTIHQERSVLNFH